MEKRERDSSDISSRFRLSFHAGKLGEILTHFGRIHILMLVSLTVLEHPLTTALLRHPSMKEACVCGVCVCVWVCVYVCVCVCVCGTAGVGVVCVCGGGPYGMINIDQINQKVHKVKYSVLSFCVGHVASHSPSVSCSLSSPCVTWKPCLVQSGCSVRQRILPWYSSAAWDHLRIALHVIFFPPKLID